MCKKAILLFLTLMITACLVCGCVSSRISDSDMDIYKKIHTYYSKMDCYSAKVAFSCFSNKTENHYTAEQKAMGNDKLFMRVHVPEKDFSVTTISNGEKTKTLTDGSAYAVTVPNADTLNLLFISQFFNLYYASEDTFLAVNSSAKGNVTLLETAVSSPGTSVSKVTLSIDNKTLAPQTLIVYDLAGNVTTSATFSDFRYNDKSITDKDFTTD